MSRMKVGLSRAVWAMAVLMLTVFSGLAAAEDLTLVKDGKAAAALVTDNNLSPSEKTAVKEFQRIFKQMTGVELPTLSAAEATKSKKPQVWIGCDLVQKAYPKIDLKGLGDEGFIIRTEGNRLLLAGGKKRGTLYAVFSFFETLGCRYWTPTEETIPEMKTITLAKLDIRETPGLEYRDLLYGENGIWADADHTGTKWGVRNKRNGFGYGKVPESWGGRINYESNLVHSYAQLMKPVGDLDGSFAKHPEYWALRGKKRSRSQPCLSHPKVLEIMTANVLKSLREHPEYQYVVVGQNDNKGYCQCDKCKALYEKYKSPAGAVVLLANQIAEEVEKIRPDVWVLAPAYQWSRKPPVGIAPRKNVGTVLCSIECDFNTPWEKATTEENKAFKADVENWAKISPRLYVWDYTTNFHHYILPHPNLDALGPNVAFLANNKCQGLFNQGSHTVKGGEFAPLRMWVLCKLMWNPKADGKKLIEEFVKGYYGPAAPHIQEYIDVIHSVGRKTPDMKLSTYSSLDSPWLTPEVIAKSELLFRRAEAAVKDDPKLLARVRKAHLPILYVLLKRQPGGPTWKATAAMVENLDPKDLAKKYLEHKVGVISEGEIAKHYNEWVEDYYGKQATADGIPLPAELKDVPREKFRLIQACQMDSRARWWQKHEGATDGWVVDCPTPAWTIRKVFLPGGGEAPLPGKTYKVFARVKTSEPKIKKGRLATIGFWGGKLKKAKRLTAEELKPGEFNTVEIGELRAEDTPVTLYLATDKKGADHMWLDCLWLQEK